MSRKIISHLAPGQIIDTQRIFGQNNAYQSISVINSPGILQVAPGGPNLQLTLTPDVDCFWEVELVAGLWAKMDAAYQALYCYQQIGQQVGQSFVLGDDDGISQTLQLFTQNSAVDQYGFRESRKIWKCSAGTQYTVQGIWSVTSGTWQYHQGPTFLWMEGVAVTQ